MIILYTTNWCPYCVAAKKFFKENNLEFTEVNIEKEDMSREDLEKISGSYTVPQIFINNRCIGGYKELLKLHQGKKLQKLLQ